jgi:hypothetical protein
VKAALVWASVTSLLTVGAQNSWARVL